MRKTLIIIITALFAATAICAAAPAQEKSALEKVWVFGKKNGGYSEFTDKIARDSMKDFSSTYSSGFDIAVEKKLAKETFPGIQPGPGAAWAGAKTYPLRLHFPLAPVNPGGYVLTLQLAGVAMSGDVSVSLDANSAPPQSQVLPPGNKEESLGTRTGGSGEARAVNFYIPASALHTGGNTVTLTVTSGAWIVYDYVLLESVEDAATPMIMNFSVDSPPFIARNGGNPSRTLRISCFHPGPEQEVALRVNLGNGEMLQKIKLSPGKCDFSSMLPDPTAPVTMDVKLTFGEKTLAQSPLKISPVRHVTIYLMPHSHLDIGYPDIQPNIMLDQRTYIENALTAIDRKSEYPMNWVVEASWPMWNLLNNIGPWEEYGPEIMNSPLLSNVPESFWKDSMNLTNVAFSATVTSSAGGGADTLNNRRLVDAAPTGWFSSGPAAGAWAELSFKTPQPVTFIAIRRGREDGTTEISSFKITLTDPDNKTETKTAGPLPKDRERLIVPVSLNSITNVRLEIAAAANPEMQATLMEVEAYVKSPASESAQKAIKAMRDGHIDVSGLYMNFLTQLIPTEWLIRSMMPTHKIAQLTGAKFETALITDVPGYSFALPDVFSGSGIRYFYTGINDYHAPNVLLGMPRAFWWQGPGGGKILVYRSFDNYNEGYFWGFTRSADLVEKLAPALMNVLDAENYPYGELPIRTLGDVIDDGPIPDKISAIAAEWNSRWQWPRVEIGLPTKFFTDFENKYGASLPTLTGDWTAYWEDGAASSAAETATMRRVHNDLLTATAFAAFQERIIGKFSEKTISLPRIEEDLYLYDEHTWGAAGSVREPNSPQTIEQWRFKQQPALDAGRLDSGRAIFLNNLFPLIRRFAPKPKHGGLVISVLNDWATPRTTPVRVLWTIGAGKVIDLHSGKESALIGHPANLPNTDTGVDPSKIFRDYTFIAENVPAMGVRYYEITSDQNPAPEVSPAKTASPSLENDFYRITVDEKTGKLSSLFDKQLSKELVDTAAGYSLNEFIYVPGTDNKDQQRISNVSVKPGVSNSLFSEITITGVAPKFKKVSQTIRLYNNIKLIEFTNDLDKEETIAKEGAYFAFPLKVPGGEVRLDVTGGVMALEKDQLPGACRDWISIQDGLAAVSDDYSVLLSTPDAPLIVPESIDVLSYRKKLDLKNTTVFSYIMNNYWDTNYKASQGGHLQFRYSLTSQAGHAKDSDIVSFVHSAAAPMQALWIDSRASGTFDAGEISFLSVEPASVRILGVKSSEDGKGITVRLQEMDGVSGPVTLHLNPLLKITTATRTNLVEETEKELEVAKNKTADAVTDNINAHGLLTIILK